MGLLGSNFVPRTLQGRSLFPFQFLAFLIISFEAPHNLRIDGNHRQDPFTDHAGGHTLGNGLLSLVGLLG